MGPVDATGTARSDSPGVLRLQIVGPLRIWRGGVEVGAGPKQQAYLLALLMAGEGRPMSTSDLIDLMWEAEPPATAVNVLHKYVGTLRRLLEPNLPARGSGSYILRRGDGYLFRAGPDTLDLTKFRALVKAAQAAITDRRLDSALDSYGEGLRLWSAPAGGGLTHGPAATSMFAGVNVEFYDACTAATQLALSLGRLEPVLTPLQLAASIAPLHEPVQASLISVLGAAGRQAEALSTFRAIRTRLAEDLGIAPGRALEDAHQRVLNQASSMRTERVVRPPDQQPSEVIWTSPQRDGLSASALVGRAEELAVLRRSLVPVLTGGTGLVLIEGEPGAGKTRLLEEVAGEADRRGAAAIWGNCMQGDGTPSLWPWVNITGTLVNSMPPAVRLQWLTGELRQLLAPQRDDLIEPVAADENAQFRLFERVVELVGQIAAAEPLTLLVDDLHWADVASLQLFAHLATKLPKGTMLVGALRDRAPIPGTALAEMLGVASRAASHRRIRLGPLDLAEVTELVRRETGQEPEAGAARRIHARTAGNPFFVRELSRLIASGRVLTEDASPRAGVPSTVHDVVRSRVADLDDSVKSLLQIAALIGRDVHVRLLARVANLDVQSCLDQLEPLQAQGLLAPRPADPSSFRFAHDLVRESVVAVTPPRRALRLHLRVADELERDDPDGESVPERIAYHLWAAGPLADPARTATALMRAGRRAAAKSALEAAERQLQLAARVARGAGLVEIELSVLTQLTTVAGMSSMYVVEAETLERAEHLARGLNREREATGFLFSRWVAMARGMVHDHGEPLARRLLEQGNASTDPVVRVYGLQAWGIQQRNAGEIGEAVKYLTQCRETILAPLARRKDDTAQHEKEMVARDLLLLMVGMLAETTAVHGDVSSAHALLKTMETATDDDPYLITVWASFATRMATLAGDSTFTLRAAERGIAADPTFSFTYLGTYTRLGLCWARAMTGQNPAEAASEAEQIIADNLLDPPVAGVGAYYTLLGEMHMAAGALAEAGAAFDRADYFLDAGGQRYPEGLTLLLRAQLMHTRGEPVDDVRAAARRAQALSTRKGAHLFAHRAADFLAALG